MTVIDTYKQLYNNHITKKAHMTIIEYSPAKNIYEYRPYSHRQDNNALDKLSELIIDNMIFYAFSEKEVVELQERYGMLNDLKNAAKYALEKRLPKRNNPTTDGTPGEILLDILIQAYEPSSQKLIVRAKFTQLGDNKELTGYDALYFTRENDHMSLWLGQVKTGVCKYCKNDIKKDLNQKYLQRYFENSMYYVADKPDPDNPLIDVLHEINAICVNAITNKWSPQKKRQSLFSLLKSSNIEIMIPCLLAYTADIYSNEYVLEDEVKKCAQDIVDYFDDQIFDVAEDLDYKIIFYVFPIENVQSLREKIASFKNKA